MKAAFLTDLCFLDKGGFPFVLEKPFVYDSALLIKPVIVPVGFKTDLASIPRFLWNILPPVGKYDQAAVVHDYLYATADQGVDRLDADRILLEAMNVCGVPWHRRMVIYAGVRVGGWLPWDTYRDRQSPPPEIAA